VSEWAHNVHIFVGLQTLARVQKLPMYILWEVELLHQLHAIGSAQKYLRMGSGGNPLRIVPVTLNVNVNQGTSISMQSSLIHTVLGWQCQ